MSLRHSRRPWYTSGSSVHLSSPSRLVADAWGIWQGDPHASRVLSIQRRKTYTSFGCCHVNNSQYVCEVRISHKYESQKKPHVFVTVAYAVCSTLAGFSAFTQHRQHQIEKHLGTKHTNYEGHTAHPVATRSNMSFKCDKSNN